jgi:cyclophilin family peptidyl-prolyl cis-trans isomerase
VALRYPATVRVQQIALIGLLALGLGCRGRGSTGAAQEHDVPPDASVADLADLIEASGLPSWGARVPNEATPELLEAELARRTTDPRLLGALEGEGRERALWSLARIGGVDARERLLVELDRSEPAALAAAALLEVPRHEPGSPPELLEGDSWGLLEDALWTRYAVSDPAATHEHRALLLSIARIGGTRSLVRLGVDLAERPGPGYRNELVARWSAAMVAVGLMCARGLTLEQTTAAAMAGGLERRPGVDPELALASLFTLSRCARSSGELLVESRELLVERLTPHVEALDQPTHAALAWRAFAALGELPVEIPVGIAGATPPEWTVEVEAVRALGSSRTGAAVLRARMRERTIDEFAGPRQHVLIASMQAMRGSIGSADAAVDAELVSLAELLVGGRRSDDPRLRKASALALCELRLLQAIRTGETTTLVRCDQLADAPAVELPEALLVNLEVEALLRATRSEGPQANLGTAAIDDEAVIADQPGEPPIDPRRRARIDRLLELARDHAPARATAGLHALAEIDDPAVLPVLRAALRSDDAGILAAAATAVAVRSVDASKRDLEAVSLLEDLVRERTSAADLEARLSAIEALGALARSTVANIDPTGSAPSAGAPASPWLARTVVPLARDPGVAVRVRAREALLGHVELLHAFDRAELESAATRPSPFPAELTAKLDHFLAEHPYGLLVRTEAGSFLIEFKGAAAPINQANLVALAEAGFFAGLDFHRVVPGFVVQGGDPRGDGYGGPGHVVPCEWSNLRYERGTVGIALAGKDTGGSQFFITHTAQPHLDARYTVIGHVADGMDVVDQLLPGDRIESVRVIYDELF